MLAIPSDCWRPNDLQQMGITVIVRRIMDFPVGSLE